ncbi:transposase, partial [Micromonospora sp. RTP1Z1]|uniref:transposase n=1 Tax=Micromonospora sp. RTP1Z1 TaxID=2994043 RepID=UPI0039B53D21
AFIRTGITNAGSEGTNRVIKTVARNAYGFRNPINQRLRTRCAPPGKAADTSTPTNFAEPPLSALLHA